MLNFCWTTIRTKDKQWTIIEDKLKMKSVKTKKKIKKNVNICIYDCMYYNNSVMFCLYIYIIGLSGGVKHKPYYNLC